MAYAISPFFPRSRGREYAETWHQSGGSAANNPKRGVVRDEVRQDRGWERVSVQRGVEW